MRSIYILCHCFVIESNDNQSKEKGKDNQQPNEQGSDDEELINDQDDYFNAGKDPQGTNDEVCCDFKISHEVLEYL